MNSIFRKKKMLIEALKIEWKLRVLDHKENGQTIYSSNYFWSRKKIWLKWKIPTQWKYG